MLAGFEIFTAVSAEVLLGYDVVFVGVNVLSFRDVCYVCINLINPTGYVMHQPV